MPSRSPPLALAADYGVLAVGRGAPWRDLRELLAAWRADPRSIISAGGSAVGGQDRMKVLVLADAAGIDPLRVRFAPALGRASPT